MPMDQLNRHAFARTVVNKLFLVVQLEHLRLIIDLDNKLLNKLLADNALELAARARRKGLAERQRHFDGLRKASKSVEREGRILNKSACRDRSTRTADSNFAAEIQVHSFCYV